MFEILSNAAISLSVFFLSSLFFTPLFPYKEVSVLFQPVKNQNSFWVIQPIRAAFNGLVFTYFNYTLRLDHTS